MLANLPTRFDLGVAPGAAFPSHSAKLAFLHLSTLGVLKLILLTETALFLDRSSLIDLDQA